MRERPAHALGCLMLALLALSVVTTTGSRQAIAQQTSTAGWLHVIWQDPPPAAGGSPSALFFLVDDHGRWTRLRVDNVVEGLADIVSSDRKRVRVSGRQETRPLRTLQTEGIDLESSPEEAAATAVAGSQKWVTILCRFSDSPAVTPRPVSWFETLMGDSYPGLDHFWREVSYGAINLSGSVVAGWYDLPNPRAGYVNGDSLDFERALRDCSTAADVDVFFPDFAGINLMFNEDLGCCAWGGSTTLTVDGQTRQYSTTWMPPWGYEAHGVVAHEMGHGFGLPHSSGPYAATYDSRWDPLSAAFGNCPPFTSHPDHGCVGVHTIAYHKDLLGWIPAERKYVATPGSTATITIERLSQPTVATNYLMAEVPLPRTMEFYTVEARRRAGYDDQVPGEGIVIHRVNPSLPDRQAQVVDPDGNGDPNDDGAVWVAGETFTDPTNGISISIASSDNTSFNVTIGYADNNLPTVTIKASDKSATEVGTATGAFTVTRTGPLMAALTVKYTVGGTATAGSDYGALAGSVVIPAGSKMAVVTVTPIDDALIEAAETVVATLSADPSYLVGSPSAATVTITDNDRPTVTITASDSTATEAGLTTGTFTVTRTAVSPPAALTVHYTVAGAATHGSDYVALSGSVVIPAGASSATITVTPVDNAVIEAAETVAVTLSANAAYIVGGAKTATVTIADNDRPTVSISATDTSATEAGPTTGTFTVTRTAVSPPAALTVNYTVGGTAVAGSDYVALSGSVVIPAGANSATITVTPINDAVVEAAEKVIVTLRPSAAYVVGSPKTATVTITSND